MAALPGYFKPEKTQVTLYESSKIPELTKYQLRELNLSLQVTIFSQYKYNQNTPRHTTLYK